MSVVGWANGNFRWYIRVLGTIWAESVDRKVVVNRFRSRSAASLLALMALNSGKRLSREFLCASIWPDSEPELARQNLRTALSSLRKQFEDSKSSGPFLDVDNHSVALQSPAVDCDWNEFRRCCAEFRQCEQAGSRSDLTDRALSLVTGPLLGDHEAPWSAPYQLSFEEDYAEIVLFKMRSLARLGDGDQAVQVGRAALTAAPLREDIHIEIMRLLGEMGKHAEVARQFDGLRSLLKSRLDVEPSDEALELVEQHTRISVPISPPDGNQVRSPAPMVKVVGRDRERHRLIQDLGPEGTDRLITLTGPGGIGKTVLAEQVCHDLSDAYGGRTWFSSLIPLTSSDQVVPALAHLFGVAGGPEDQLSSALINELEKDRSLLVLDNAEHLDGVEQVVTQLLRDVGTLRILVTSRRPLGVEGESCIPLTPLVTPGDKDSFSTIQMSPAVQLLELRTRKHVPEFRLNPSNARALAAICRIVDGIPLALELVSARLAAESPAQALQHLASGGVLTLARKGDGRRSSLSAVLDSMVDTLDEPLRRTFCRLSWFRGSFTAEAAGAAAGVDGFEVTDGLFRSSLLARETHRHSVRFRLLEPVRQYALKHLSAEEAAELNASMAAYWLDKAASARLAFDGPEAVIAAEELELDLESLRCAADWYAEFGDPSLAVQIAMDLSHFANNCGHFLEWNRKLWRWIPLAENLKPADKARALAALASMHNLLGESEHVLAGYQSAYEIWVDVGSPIDRAGAGNNLALAYQRLGRFDDAAAIVRESLGHLGQPSTLPALWAVLKANEAVVQRQRGLLNESRACSEEALQICTEAGNVRMVSYLQGDMARVAMLLGDREGFKLWMRRFSETNHELGSSRGFADECLIQAWYDYSEGRSDAALASCRQAISHAESIDYRTAAGEAGVLAAAVLACGKAPVGEIVGLAMGLEPSLFERLSSWERSHLTRTLTEVPTHAVVGTSIAELRAAIEGLKGLPAT